MLRRRRPQLGAVESDAAEAHQPGFGAQGQHLDEEGVDGVEVAAPKARDRAVVRSRVRTEPAEGHVDMATPFHLPRAGDPGRVGEEQELEHHGGVIGRSARGLRVGVVDAVQVEHVLDHLGNEAGLVVLGQPVVEGGREEEGLGLVVVAEALVDPGRELVGGPDRLPFHLEELVADPIICHVQILANPQQNRESKVSPHYHGRRISRLASLAGSDPRS